MGWSISTYAGTYMGGQPSNARTALFELIRALHERQDLVGGGRTPMWTAAGTESTTITSADLAGIRATGAPLSSAYSWAWDQSAPALENLRRVQGGLLSMVDSFTETSGRSDRWTEATLSTAVGYDLTVTPERPNDAAFWQALQDAFDLLIYAYLTQTPAYGNPGFPPFPAAYEGSGGSLVGLQTAWDGAIADIASGGLASGVLQWEVNHTKNGSGDSSYTADIRHLVENGRVSGISFGTIQAVDLRGSWTRANSGNGSDPDDDYFGGGLTVSVLGGSFSSGTFGSGVHTKEQTVTGSTSGMNALKYFDLDGNVPTTVPFTLPGISAGQVVETYTRFSFAEVVYYVDIAGELTDQA